MGTAVAARQAPVGQLVDESGTGAVAVLEAAVDELTGVDPDRLDLDQLAGALEQAQRQAERLAAWRARCLASYDRRRPKTAAGPAPVDQLAGGLLRQDRRDAARQVRTARQLDDLPAVQAAFDEGRITQRHADVLADTLADEAVRALPGAAQQLLAAAQRVDPRQLQLQARKLAIAADQDAAAARERAAHARRSARLSPPDHHGMVHLHARLSQVGAEIVATAIGALMRPDPPDVPPDQRRTPDQRRADALVQLARIALDHDQLPDVARRRPHILVLVTHRDPTGDPHVNVDDRAGAAVAELAHTGAVSNTTAARLACAADLTPVAVDRHGTPLWLGRTRRDPSTAQINALVARDRRCRRCGAPASHCQAHHITWWEHGGPTDLDNLVLVCWACHDLIHHHAWRVALHPDNTAVFTAPDGTAHQRPPP
ncbi:MAG: HNH endonuclease [Actinobacteria bacterium]|nr:HNH endonuclease [Actinomycetota bacterium]